MDKDLLLDTTKDYLVRTAVKQLMAWLIKKASWVALGPVNWFISMAITKMFSIFFTQIEIGIRLLMIHINVTRDVSAVNDAIEEIKEKKKQGATDEELKELDEKLANAARDLINFGSN